MPVQVFECMRDGQRVFSDRACGNDARVRDVDVAGMNTYTAPRQRSVEWVEQIRYRFLHFIALVDQCSFIVPSHDVFPRDTPHDAPIALWVRPSPEGRIHLFKNAQRLFKRFDHLLRSFCPDAIDASALEGRKELRSIRRNRHTQAAVATQHRFR
jgi:hypothetical protein